MLKAKLGTFIAVITLMLFFQSILQAQSSALGSSAGAGASTPAAGMIGQSNESPMVSGSQQVSSRPFATSPILGAKVFGVGFTGPSQSYFIPSFQWTSFADTNLGFASSQEQPIYQSTGVGSLTLQHVTPNTQFNLSYAGGAQVYNRGVIPAGAGSKSTYGAFDQLSLGESVNGERWNLFVGDQGSYLPESPGGFEGFGGLQSFNSGLGGAVLSSAGNLNPLLQPDQSILTFSRRFDNTSVGQFQYNLSPLTSVTVTGGYGVLQFLEPGFTDEDYTSVLAGLAHTLGPRDSAGVTYLQSLIHFHSPGQDIRQRGVLFSFGHRLMGRLSVELSGGPLDNQFGSLTGGPVSQVLWTTEDSLHYHWARTAFSTTYSRSTTGGSGILRGAETNLLGIHVGRQFTRTTYMGWDVDYAKDRALQQPLAGASQAASNVWEGEVTFSHELGADMSFYFQYGVQREVANAALCVANRCGVTFLRQIGGFGFNWHTRPLRLR